jgi:hypothetical protein
MSLSVGIPEVIKSCARLKLSVSLKWSNFVIPFVSSHSHRGKYNRSETPSGPSSFDISVKRVPYNRKRNLEIAFLRYNRDFVISVIVITEFDCIFKFRSMSHANRNFLRISRIHFKILLTTELCHDKLPLLWRNIQLINFKLPCKTEKYVTLYWNSVHPIINFRDFSWRKSIVTLAGFTGELYQPFVFERRQGCNTVQGNYSPHFTRKSLRGGVGSVQCGGNVYCLVDYRAAIGGKQYDAPGSYTVTYSVKTSSSWE